VEERPGGGESCLLKNSLGKIKWTIKEENTLVIAASLVTIIGLYINPQTYVDDAVEIIMRDLMHARDEENILILGDLNCRIDKPDNKSKTILALLEEEGYSLVNNKDLVTYVAHN